MKRKTDPFDFWMSWSLDELAKEQGVKPIDQVEVLFDIWPGDMNDDFEKEIRKMRWQNSTEYRVETTSPTSGSGSIMMAAIRAMQSAVQFELSNRAKSVVIDPKKEWIDCACNRDRPF